LVLVVASASIIVWVRMRLVVGGGRRPTGQPSAVCEERADF